MEQERNTSEQKSSLPFETVKKLIATSLILGFLGGIGGAAFFQDYMPQGAPARRVQESSNVIDVVNKVSPSVVSITVEGQDVDIFGFSRSTSGAGTGIILTDDGLILTNKHVVEDDNARYSVFTSDGKEYTGARVVARDPFNDVAFLRISARGLKPAELGDSSSLVVGQRVVAIGNALGQFQNTATDGIVSGLGRPIVAEGSNGGAETLTNLIQTDAAINPGNSGGPLVNLDGQVIGINTAIAGNAQSIGFAIPINEVSSAIKSVKENGKITRPYLGVRYVPLTAQIAAQENLSVSEGAYLQADGGASAVLPNSPAAKVGLREGDIITKVNNHKVDTKNSLTALIGKHKVGDEVTLTIIRDGKEQTVRVTLAEAPASL